MDFNWNNIPQPLVDSINHLMKSNESLQRALSVLEERFDDRLDSHHIQLIEVNKKLDDSFLGISEKLGNEIVNISRTVEVLRLDVNKSREFTEKLEKENQDQSKKTSSMVSRKINTISATLNKTTEQNYQDLTHKFEEDKKKLEDRFSTVYK